MEGVTLTQKIELLGAVNIIVSEPSLLKYDRFICIAVANIMDIRNSHSEELMDEYKPSKDGLFSEITDSPGWSGGYSWWDWGGRPMPEGVFNSKMKYLRLLADHLQKEIDDTI